MQPKDPAGKYSDQAVIDALSGRYGPRQISFRYDRLNASNTLIASVDYVVKASVAYDMLANIKRTAKFTLLDRATINYGSDRIRPWARLAMRDGGFVEWPQGVFLLSTPKRVLDKNGITVSREVDAYDQLQVLSDDKVTTRYAVTATTVYTTAIATLLTTVVGIGLTNVVPSASAVPADLEWAPGTSKLSILNELLGAINYESAFFDEFGTLICRPYQSPSTRPAEYAYNTDSASVITGEVGQTVDLFAIPNVFVLTVSEPDQSVLTSTYTNANPLSPTSTVSRGRSIVSFNNSASAPDQTTLDAQAQRAAFEASQVYETIPFNTLFMPLHSNADVYTLNVTGLGVGDKYGETSWSCDLDVGAVMQHNARRIVSV